MASPRRDLGRIVVVGGGIAGTRTCEHLRRMGYEHEIVLLAAENHPPYDRPPLTKEVLRGEREDSTLAVDLDALGVEVVLGTTATRLDLEHSVVHTETTDSVAGLSAVSAGQTRFDAVVIATGGSPVRLPGSGEQLTVRTIDDSRRLRARLVPGAHVAIVGAGWIGAEVATSALARGCKVSCIEAGGAPGSQVLGDEVGKRMVPWWDDVDLRLGTSVKTVGDGSLELSDGSALTADVVVVGVGMRPNTAWLEGSGLAIDRGVVVDEWLQAAPNVVAVGDVAAWPSRRYGTRMRVEHWDDAVAGAGVAASTLLNGPTEADASVHDPVPYFWSDQFGRKVQYVGHHDPQSAPIWREVPDCKGWGAAWFRADGRLAAYLAVDCPRDLMSARRVLMAGGTPDPARLADPGFSITDA